MLRAPSVSINLGDLMRPPRLRTMCDFDGMLGDGTTRASVEAAIREHELEAEATGLSPSHHLDALHMLLRMIDGHLAR